MKEELLRKAIRKIISENTNGFPDFEKWWEYNPEELMKWAYWQKGQIPPSDPTKYEKNWNSMKSQLQQKFPPPTDPATDSSIAENTPLVWVKENEGGWSAKGYGPAFSMANVKHDTSKNVYELKIKKNGRTYKKSNASSLDECNMIFEKITGHSIKFESNSTIPSEPDLDINIDPYLKQKGLIKKEGYSEPVENGCEKALGQPVEKDIKVKELDKLKELNTSTYGNLSNKTADYPYVKQHNNPVSQKQGNSQQRVNTLAKERFETEFYKEFPKETTIIKTGDGDFKFDHIKFEANHMMYSINFINKTLSTLGKFLTISGTPDKPYNETKNIKISNDPKNMELIKNMLKYNN